ncbi:MULTISPECIES: hypothetical protein [unclassified Chamaesiphon]|uniref:hypothetical protein n=1 Tax=unclassified Chamaesiphon TaxID=2620921 RepID=UPI00286B6509|nr:MULTISPECIES: hypothetical protein [unclassified Chamaesiphon]
MLQLNSLAIGLVAALSICQGQGFANALTANAFTPIDNISLAQPAANLHAQVNINIGIGSQPYPQPQRVIFVESAPRPQNVIVVEKYRRSESENYRDNSRWAESRGRYGKYYKHGRGHSKYRRDRDDD